MLYGGEEGRSMKVTQPSDKQSIERESIGAGAASGAALGAVISLTVASTAAAPLLAPLLYASIGAVGGGTIGHFANSLIQRHRSASRVHAKYMVDSGAVVRVPRKSALKKKRSRTGTAA